MSEITSRLRSRKKKSPGRQSSRFKSPSKSASVSRKRKRSGGGNVRNIGPTKIEGALLNFLHQNSNLLKKDEKDMLAKNMFTRARATSVFSRYSKRPQQRPLNERLGKPDRFAFWADEGMADFLGRGYRTGSSVGYGRLQAIINKYFVKK